MADSMFRHHAETLVSCVFCTTAVWADQQPNRSSHYSSEYVSSSYSDSDFVNIKCILGDDCDILCVKSGQQIYIHHWHWSAHPDNGYLQTFMQ